MCYETLLCSDLAGVWLGVPLQRVTRRKQKRAGTATNDKNNGTSKGTNHAAPKQPTNNTTICTLLCVIPGALCTCTTRHTDAVYANLRRCYFGLHTPVNTVELFCITAQCALQLVHSLGLQC